jgi:aminopeptidase N
MVKKLLHEAVRLEIDLATSTVRGRAELDVQQRADQRQLQLHCKQCDVTKCSVNGVDSKYLASPSLPQICPHPHTPPVCPPLPAPMIEDMSMEV